MALPQDHIRAMEQLRSRLQHLSRSMIYLQEQLAGHEPLPSWPTLQAASTTLGTHLGEVAGALNAQRQLFTSLHPYPLPSFPGVTQEILLQQLLRKKPEPIADEWVDNALNAQKKDGQLANGGSAKAVPDSLSAEDMRELWDWAGQSTGARMIEMEEEGVFEDVYSIQERRDGINKVVTGLQRPLDDVSEEEDSEKDVKMDEDEAPKADEKPAVNGLDPSQPPMPLEDLLRLQSGA